MGYGFSAADIAYLASPPGAAALAEVAERELTAASQLSDVAAVRRAHGDRAPALIETVRLRRRAAAKLSGTQDWLFTDDALQQATPTLVARHRAARLAGRDVHDVTCSIGAELVELARVCPRVVGSDLDPVRLAMARHNLSRPASARFSAAARGEHWPVSRPSAGQTDGRNESAPDRSVSESPNAEWVPGHPGSAAVSRSASGTEPDTAPEPEPRNVAEATLSNTLVVRADALAPCTAGTVIIADPARRAGGKRTFDPAALQPPLPDLLAAYPGRDMAVKCAPGLDFDRLGWPGEVEVVSLDGAVREACLWSPGLGEPGVTRRATVLTGAGTITTLTDAEPDEIPDRAPGEWIVDPDGAVVRAGLVRHYAARHGLWQLDPRIAYLTGDRLPAGVRGFRIVDRLEFREKTLRSELRRRNCGPLEILVRGVDADPDALRRRLKPSGSEPYTLVVTRIGRTAAAFLCRASR
ncbi:class I SAM-dependent methyltransferase [Nocardia flavorosea]|uniref:class I SAM-dependent methyltransferase n=2 Tax=Nocardia TaxID=1817 RepID=UPI0018950061|nr:MULTISPECIES: class I SAM-dependent methyltransferase [Nocardia]MBF6349090.1 class I SAM-dependent methyltransferase [Nocardia flavorosea]